MKRVNLLTVQDWVILARESGYKAKILAKRHRLSTRQLDRYTHTLFKCSIQSWLNERRCIDACDLLRDCVSIKEVAYQLGFKQASHFTRVFKAYYRVTPSEFFRFTGPLSHLSGIDNKCPREISAQDCFCFSKA